MHKLAALVLAAVIGVAGAVYANPAEARVYVGVGIGLPGVALAVPPVLAYPPALYAPYYAPYYYGRPYYRGPGFVRSGYGFRGYGYVHGRRWR
jgi:hypothetical protein